MLFKSVENRDQAAQLHGSEIGLLATDFPSLKSGEYYWHQLVGLKVYGDDGYCFGHITGLMETGANDVLVIKGSQERLIPYSKDVVIKIDIQSGQMLVNWDKDF